MNLEPVDLGHELQQPAAQSLDLWLPPLDGCKRKSVESSRFARAQRRSSLMVDDRCSGPAGAIPNEPKPKELDMSSYLGANHDDMQSAFEALDHGFDEQSQTT
jgi:hypothetical protein